MLRRELCQYRRALTKTVKSLRWVTAMSCLACGLALGLALVSATAHGQSLLLGPAPRLVKSRPVYDPVLPTGAARAAQFPQPEAGLQRACSATHPLCVSWPKADPQPAVLLALASLERAYDHFVYALRLPEPLRNDAGEPLTWRLAMGREPLRTFLVPSLSAPLDAAAVLCRGGTEEEVERDAHLCLGEAIAARLDAGETPEVRRAYALQLWWTLGQYTQSDAQLIIAAQSNPQTALFARSSDRSLGTSALFFEYLAARHGVSALSPVSTAMLALSAQRTRADAWRYDNSPDVTDVVRSTFEDKEGVWAQQIVDFGFARSLTGASDQALLPIRWLGEGAAPRVDWVIKTSTLPRRVAPALPIEPWGSTFVRVELDDPPDQLQLGLKIQWEAPIAMRWQIAKLDENQKELGRFDIAFEQRGTEIERRLVALEGTRSLLIVGTNLGGVDLAHPFDPDHEPFEPHGCTLYMGKL